jgi:probable rRNA maturation factor
MLDLISKKTFNIKENFFFDTKFVNDTEIKKINNTYCKKNKTTDVLTFALYDAKKSIKTKLIGEIFINIDAAKRDFKKNSITYYDEIKMLFVHGVLHLLGYEHKTTSEWNKMISLQKKILGYFKENE